MNIVNIRVHVNHGDERASLRTVTENFLLTSSSANKYLQAPWKL